MKKTILILALAMFGPVGSNWAVPGRTGSNEADAKAGPVLSENKAAMRSEKPLSDRATTASGITEALPMSEPWQSHCATEDPAPPYPMDSWADRLVYYATTEFLPPPVYRWNWKDAVLLKSVADLYEHDALKKDAALVYIRAAIHNSLHRSHGKHPNAVASAMGLPLLYRITGEELYMDNAREIYRDYRAIPRADNGGVSHRADVTELWDDTVYMIGLFFLEMYRTTGEEEYLRELVFQLLAHHEKLCDPATGLWFHGWDNDDTVTDDQCCLYGWSDNPERRNDEFWGRGNGWIAMTLVDCLAEMAPDDPDREALETMLHRMTDTLLPLQDEATGHWLQLPLRTEDLGRGNFIESSCTAMFGYTMAKGIGLGLLDRDRFLPAVTRAYHGILRHSIVPTGDLFTVSNVCAGTCIGDKEYYYQRKIVEGTEFGLGAVVMFDVACRELGIERPGGPGETIVR